MFSAENQVGIRIKPMFPLSFCFQSKYSKRFSMVRLTDAVIQLEREIMQQKEKLNSSSTELRIMIRWCIILLSLPLTVGILNQIMFIYHYLFTLVLESPNGEWPTTYTFTFPFSSKSASTCTTHSILTKLELRAFLLIALNFSVIYLTF